MNPSLLPLREKKYKCCSCNKETTRRQTSRLGELSKMCEGSKKEIKTENKKMKIEEMEPYMPSSISVQNLPKYESDRAAWTRWHEEPNPKDGWFAIQCSSCTYIATVTAKHLLHTQWYNVFADVIDPLKKKEKEKFEKILSWLDSLKQTQPTFDYNKIVFAICETCEKPTWWSLRQNVDMKKIRFGKSKDENNKEKGNDELPILKLTLNVKLELEICNDCSTMRCKKCQSKCCQVRSEEEE